MLLCGKLCLYCLSVMDVARPVIPRVQIITASSGAWPVCVRPPSVLLLKSESGTPEIYQDNPKICDP